MTTTPIPSKGGWSFEEGEDAHLKLAAAITQSRVAKAGGFLKPEDIYKLLCRVRNRTLPAGRVVPSGDSKDIQSISLYPSKAEDQTVGLISIEIGNEWRVSAAVLRRVTGAMILTSTSDLETKAKPVSFFSILSCAQDLPSGSPAQTVILAENKQEPRPRAFIAGETHFFHGKK